MSRLGRARPNRPIVVRAALPPVWAPRQPLVGRGQSRTVRRAARRPVLVRNAPPANQTVILAPATVTVTAVAFARTPGAVARPVVPTTVTVTGLAFAPATTDSVPLTPTTVTVTPAAVARTPGAATRPAVPATVTVTGQTFARVALRTLPFVPASVTLTPATVARTVGATTRPLSPVVLIVTAQPAGRTPGAKPVVFGPATVTVSAVLVVLHPAAARAIATATVGVSAQTVGLFFVQPHRACVALTLAGVEVGLVVSDTTRIGLTVADTSLLDLALEECPT